MRRRPTGTRAPSGSINVPCRTCDEPIRDYKSAMKDRRGNWHHRTCWGAEHE